MSDHQLAVVTGAFGYLGKYITTRLLAQGTPVRTLTGHPDRKHPLRERIDVVPFHFDDPQQLVRDLQGVHTVFNTYWVRFSRGRITHGGAVANTQNLIRAAVEAGVDRFVHISVTKPELQSRLSYFRGKAIMEKTLVESGLSYAILRPTVLFGTEDILVNNIAWLLRRLPVFGLFGNGEYRLQPVYVDDVAALAVELAGERDNRVVDAVGPETYAYRDMVRSIARAVGSRSRLVALPPSLALLVARLLEPIVRDKLVTRGEVDGLMSERLVSEGPPACPTRLSTWLTANATNLGNCYASELQRHYR